MKSWFCFFSAVVVLCSVVSRVEQSVVVVCTSEVERLCSSCVLYVRVLKLSQAHAPADAFKRGTTDIAASPLATTST